MGSMIIIVIEFITIAVPPILFSLILFYLLEQLYSDSLIILERIDAFIKFILESDFMAYVYKLLPYLFFPLNV